MRDKKHVEKILMENEGELFMKNFLRKYSWLLVSMIPEILILLISIFIIVDNKLDVFVIFSILSMISYLKMPYVLIYFAVKIIFLFCSKIIFKMIDSKIDNEKKRRNIKYLYLFVAFVANVALVVLSYIWIQDVNIH